MNDVMPFEFEGRSIPIVIDGTNPMFWLPAVAKVIGSQNPSALARMLEDDEKGRIKVTTPGGEQHGIGVTEAGLYRILMRSNNPNARPFQHWVVSEVLPSIRKHGGYIAGQEKLATGEMTREELVAKALLHASEPQLSAPGQRCPPTGATNDN